MTALAAVVVTLAVLWWFVRSRSTMTALRVERAGLRASIEDFTNRGGRLTHTLCGDQKRFCVLIPAKPMTWNTTDNKEAVYVVSVGY